MHESHIHLKGGHVYAVYGTEQAVIEPYVRDLSEHVGAVFVPFVFDQGNRETIEKIKELLSIKQQTLTTYFLSTQKPYTHDSQALLLKAFEELNETIIVVLHAASKKDLLATVRSRTIELATPRDPKESAVMLQSGKEFLHLNPEKRLKLVATYVPADGEAAPEMIENLVAGIESTLVKSDVDHDTLFIALGVVKLFHEARNARTIPPKTLFEYLAVSLPVI